MERRRQPQPYYMTYPIPKEIRGEEEGRRDRAYFRQLYPGELKQYLREVKNTVDKLEYKDSFIYHEYPDQIRLEETVEEIINNTSLENRRNRAMLHHIILLLLYDEIYGRRNNL